MTSAGAGQWMGQLRRKVRKKKKSVYSEGALTLKLMKPWGWRGRGSAQAEVKDRVGARLRGARRAGW